MGSTSLIATMLFILIFVVFPIFSLFHRNDIASVQNLDIENHSLPKKENLLNGDNKLDKDFIFRCLFWLYSKITLGIAFVLIFANPLLAFGYLVCGFIIGLLPLYMYYLTYTSLLKLNWANFFTIIILAVFICYIFLYVILGYVGIGKMLFPIGVIHSVLTAIFAHKKYLNNSYS